MRLYRLLAILLVLIMLVGCNAQTDGLGAGASSITSNTVPKQTAPTTATTSSTQKPNGDSVDNSGEQTPNKDNVNGTGDQTPEEKEEEEDNVLKILTIGNSFSDDTMQYVYNIAAAAGYTEIKLGNLYIGGCSLNTHANNARGDKAAYEYRRNSSGVWQTTSSFKMSDALKEEEWDYVSLQQASGSSGIASTYSELEYMIGYVKSLAPGARIVWNMTWAYQQNSTHSDFPKYNSSQNVMYQSILSAVLECVEPNKNIVKIVPNGTAIQNARTSYVGDTLTRDGYHLSLQLGRYIAGLTFFHALTGRSIENISYRPDGVGTALYKVAVEAAMNAVKEPWDVTASKYTEEPGLDLSEYEKLDLNWTAFGYWHSNHESAYNYIISNGSSLSKQFYASARFTEEDIPVGSIIVVAEGWKYRPEAWEDEGRLTSTRPGNVTEQTVEVTATWWSKYEYRAFNLSRTDGSSLEGVSLEEIQNAFTVYVPKKN